jgi:hypothetical protein
MFQDDMPASSRASDQVWFSMLLVNDPNAALFGALRPLQPHPLVVALRRPLEWMKPAPHASPASASPGEAALRPSRASRWVGAALLLLGFGLAEAALEQLTASETPRAATAAVSRVGATRRVTGVPLASSANPAIPTRAARAGLGSELGGAPAPLDAARTLAPSALTRSITQPMARGKTRSLKTASAAASVEAATVAGRATTSAKKKARNVRRNRRLHASRASVAR